MTSLMTLWESVEWEETIMICYTTLGDGLDD